jgi:hypothetical protein
MTLRFRAFLGAVVVDLVGTGRGNSPHLSPGFKCWERFRSLLNPVLPARFVPRLVGRRLVVADTSITPFVLCLRDVNGNSVERAESEMIGEKV